MSVCRMYVGTWQAIGVAYSLFFCSWKSISLSIFLQYLWFSVLCCNSKIWNWVNEYLQVFHVDLNSTWFWPTCSSCFITVSSMLEGRAWLSWLSLLLLLSLSLLMLLLLLASSSSREASAWTRGKLSGMELISSSSVFDETISFWTFCSQFNQHFTSSVLHQYSFAKKLQSQTVIREKLPKILLYKKAVLKCWWNAHLVFYDLITTLFSREDGFDGNSSWKSLLPITLVQFAVSVDDDWGIGNDSISTALQEWDLKEKIQSDGFHI